MILTRSNPMKGTSGNSELLLGTSLLHFCVSKSLAWKSNGIVDEVGADRASDGSGPRRSETGNVFENRSRNEKYGNFSSELWWLT